MRHHLRYYCLLAVTSISLNGCSYNDRLAGQQASPLLPIIEQAGRLDLDDQHVTAAVRDYLKHKQAPPFSQYDFMRVDLDQDGWQDALIYITAPYGEWCNAHGCTVLVLHAKENGFTIAGEIFPIRPPFYISDTFSDGWRNIIVRVSGRTEKAKNVVLRFDGTKYQENAAELPATNQMLHPIHMRAFP